MEESNLTVQISALRRVLDVAQIKGSCIQTVPGRGYRFVAQVANALPGSVPSPSLVPESFSTDQVQRRLAAILVADVAGYSRLINRK